MGPSRGNTACNGQESPQRGEQKCCRQAEHFARHVTLRAMPPLRPCAFCLSGVAW